jgi:tetraacyldisaccharide 4'-kinase
MKIVDRRRMRPLMDAPGGQRVLLFPLFYGLSLAYGELMAVWRRLPPRPVRTGVPVVSVGSTIVGGTGKTPLCMLVAGMLASSGRKVCLISRGYMRRGGCSPLLVSDGRRLLADVREAGDEPYLLAKRLPGVRVIVDKDRARAAQSALSGERPDVFLLDDGFQTRTIVKNLEIVCLDAESLSKRQFFVPLGRLREGLAAIGPNHAVVVKLEQDEAPPGPSVLGRLRTPLIFLARRERPVLVDSEGRPVEEARHKKRRFLALSGVARPAAFERSCEACGLDVAVSVRMDDHHWYDETDAQEVGNLMTSFGCDGLVTTEKDFYRLPKALGSRAIVLRDQLAMDEALRFSEMLETHVRV